MKGGSKRLHTIIPSLWYKMSAASPSLCHLIAVSTITESCQLQQRKNMPFVAPLDTVTGVPFNLPRGEWVLWCGTICGWCCIDWAWVAHSDYSRNGDYECNKDNWLTHCANWRSTEVLSVLSGGLCERLSVSSTVTVKLALLFKTLPSNVVNVVSE